MSGLGFHHHAYQSIPLEETTPKSEQLDSRHNRNSSKRLTILAIILLVGTCGLAISQAANARKSVAIPSASFADVSSESSVLTSQQQNLKGAIETKGDEQDHPFFYATDSDSDYSYSYDYEIMSDTSSSTSSDTIDGFTYTELEYGAAIIGIGVVVLIGVGIGVKKAWGGKEG
mmetsp:Transcript_43933/g.68712  ORF Transcript_43933/g.68712 Transcript_43933/m.68712 type:complete len:173 (-) Transcript_43933:497-1015(-)